MKSRRKGINIDAVRRLVIFGAIGIIALAFGWLALNQNTESRSRAALTEKIYKSWEFQGTAEGWVGESGTTLKPSANTLIVSVPGNTGASIRQDLVNTALPYGNKYLKVMLSLTPGVSRVLGMSDESVINSQGLVSRGDGGFVTGESIQSGAGSDVGVSSQVRDRGWLSPVDINDAPPIGWPGDPIDTKCTPPPPPCKTGPCPLYEPPPPRGGWCPTTKCRPCPVRLINGACPLGMVPPEGGWCEEPPPKTTTTRKLTPVPGGTSFTLTMYYQLTGKTTWEKPVVKTGLTSKGSFAEYPMLLPGIAPMTIAKLKLQVSNVKILGSTITTSDYTMLIDRIRLTGPVPKLTPTPPIGCRYEPVKCVKAPCEPVLVCPSVAPTCTPEPPCLYSEPACAMDPMPPPGGWCPRPSPAPNVCTGKPDGTPCSYEYCPPCPKGEYCIESCWLQEGTCQDQKCVSVPKPTPKPTCTPEPPCFYSEPYCRLDIPVPPGGWCPRPIPAEASVLYEAPPRPGKHWTCRLFPNRSWCK